MMVSSRPCGIFSHVRAVLALCRLSYEEKGRCPSHHRSPYDLAMAPGSLAPFKNDILWCFARTLPVLSRQAQQGRGIFLRCQKLHLVSRSLIHFGDVALLAAEVNARRAQVRIASLER